MHGNIDGDAFTIASKEFISFASAYEVILNDVPVARDAALAFSRFASPDFGTLPPTEMAERLLQLSQCLDAAILESIGKAVPEPPGESKDPGAFLETVCAVEQEEGMSPEIQVFISHSSRDEELAKCLITLIRSALYLPSASIRCTSVDGFRLPAGVPTEERLRQEIHDSKVFIGLITPNSMESIYVLFELGARWGARKALIPLLAKGADSRLLKGPLSALNALNCDSPGQLHQFIEELSAHLSTRQDRPAAYQEFINEVIAGSRQLAEQSEQGRVLNEALLETGKKPQLKWGCYQFEGEQGLFCTACYDTKGQKIQTTRMNSNFRMCPVCKAKFGS